ncbi:MAG: rhomboid family intramembrane serine protease [Elusimicrobia bacterium]|nr:rhomboid family intramembrane serine protease [Elusimicrobiota bacterium]
MYPSSSLPRVILVLLAAFTACFGVQQVAPMMVPMFGLTPFLVLKRWWLWQPATYIFLHGNFIHLLFNGLSLYWFGATLAYSWGTARFLFYFFLCGIGAGFLVVATQPLGTIPTIGASGAIYGLLYAWAKENPEAIVYMYGLFPMRAKHLVILLGVIEFMLSYTPSPIARFAHLGGLLMGWLYFRFAIFDLRLTIGGLLSSRPREEPDPEEVTEREIDRILEKISAHGMDSLTPWEKKILDEASHQQKGNY